MKRLYGITTAMVTPFTEAGEVDVPAVRALTDFLIEKGVHGLFPLGTTGEMNKLSIEERKQVAEAVISQAAGRVHVFIQVGAQTMGSTLELARHALEAGADGIGVVTPFFLGADDRELEEYYVTVAKQLPDDFPVYLYNIPQASANDLKPEVAERIVRRTENVVGIKYSYPDFVRLQEYSFVNGGDFSVLTGTDRLLTAALALGCDGTVSGVSGVWPEPFVRAYEAFCMGDLETARTHQSVATAYCVALKGGSNMSYFKEALKMRGIDVGGMRRPQLDLTASQLSELKSALEKVESRNSDIN